MGAETQKNVRIRSKYAALTRFAIVGLCLLLPQRAHADNPPVESLFSGWSYEVVLESALISPIGFCQDEQDTIYIVQRCGSKVMRLSPDGKFDLLRPLKGLVLMP